LLAVRVGGDVVGETALMNGGKRTATVSASGRKRVVAVRLDEGALRDVLGRHPDAAISLASAISRKLRTATRRRVDIGGCSAKVRMARVLLEMAEDYGCPGANGMFIGVSLTQFELGALVGVSETTARRALSELRKDGVVVNAGRRLLVPDMSVLRSAAWET
jgi:CRP/FNR family cyclic AMP-dependent transcriptional regulator